MAGNRGPWLSTATALFFCWATLSLLVRWWVKLKRRDNWGWDDTSISTAFLIALFHIGTIFWSVNYGYGRPLSSPELHRDEVEKSLYASQISYLVAIGLTKVSTSFFIGRLTRYAPQVFTARLLAGISGVWTVGSVLTIAFRGDLSLPWRLLDGSDELFVRWIVVEVIGLVIEVILFALAVNLIWDLKMKMTRRFLILGAFGFRLGLIPLVIVRLMYLSPTENATPTYTSIIPSIITEGTLQFAFMSASVTSLKPFLRPFHSGRHIVNTRSGVAAPGATGNSGFRSNASNTAGGKSDRTYYELSATTTMMSDDRTRTTSRTPSFAFDGKGLGLGTSTSFVEAVPSSAPPPRSEKTRKRKYLTALGVPTSPLPAHIRKTSPRRERAPPTPLAQGHYNADDATATAANEEGNKSRSGSRSHSISRSLDSFASSDRLIIRRKREWSVRYEDRDDVVVAADDSPCPAPRLVKLPKSAIAAQKNVPSSSGPAPAADAAESDVGVAI